MCARWTPTSSGVSFDQGLWVWVQALKFKRSCIPARKDEASRHAWHWQRMRRASLPRGSVAKLTFTRIN